MSEPFLSEIRIMSFNFAPRGWATCDGQMLPINQNQALFSLLGTTFGGDGRVTFALPDLRSRVPIHVGNGHTLGEKGGELAHTLTSNEMPLHAHLAGATTNNASTPLPGNALLASAQNLYAAPGSLTTLDPSTIAPVGGSQPHLNLAPFLTLTFCIALVGIYPSPN